MLNIVLAKRLKVMFELEAIHGKTAPVVDREAAEIKDTLICTFGHEDALAIWQHVMRVRETNILLSCARVEMFNANSDEIHEPPPIIDWNHNER